MNAKYYYDEKHQSFFMKSKDSAFIQLHKKYNISFITVLDLKLNQQYVEPFKILKKIERLVYRLKFSQHWRIYSMLSIIQLKSSLSKIDSFDRFKFNHFSWIFVKDDIENVKSYTLKKMINKRLIARREPKYLIRWKEYKSENNIWRSLSKIKNAMNLIKNYKKMIENITYFFERLNTSAAVVFYKKFSTIAFEFTKAFASSFKASTSSSEIIHRNSSMIISILLKSSPLSLQKIFVSSSSSSKTFVQLRRSFQLFHRFSRLLLSFFW